MIRQIATAICLFACIASALAGNEKKGEETKDEEMQAETPSSVLQSLPAEAKEHIEDLQKACREFNLPPGDSALTQFTLSGQKAVMLNDLTICGGRCLRGANCSNRNSYDISIYVRSGSGWRRVFKEMAQGDTFLSLESDMSDSNNNDRFRMLAIRIFSGNKQCPVKEKGPMAWKLSCDASGDMGRH